MKNIFTSEKRVVKKDRNIMSFEKLIHYYDIQKMAKTFKKLIGSR